MIKTPRRAKDNTMIAIVIKTMVRCEICGLSKTLDGADFVHVRLGLDEAPEPLLCKCKDPVVVLNAIVRKYSISVAKVVESMVPSTTIDLLPDVSMNSVSFETMASKAVREVEVRLDSKLSQAMFQKMNEGFFEHTNTSEVQEVGCTWWTGPESNLNAKVRARSTGEKTLKVTREVIKVAPGYTLAISDEYGFEGKIAFPQYDVTMKELKSMIMIRNTSVTVISRMYGSGDSCTFASEFEIGGEFSHAIVRMVLCLVISTVGSVKSMVRLIDSDFMGEVRSNDHVVVDISSATGHKGVHMVKVDGVKTYVFCYEFGYVVCITDPDLTVVSCMVVTNHRTLPDMMAKPDVILAEMLMNGDLVFINVLAVDGRMVTSGLERMSKPNITTERPIFIYRKQRDAPLTKTQAKLEPMPNDGLVIVNSLRTLRLKQPTLDLMYSDGSLNAVENSVMVAIAPGHENMMEGVVYELDVIRNTDTDTIELVNPRERMMKKMPNPVDVVTRAIAAVLNDTTMNEALIDITAMSFQMRSKVYSRAQERAPANRKVIVTFGAGRFQEWRQMLVRNFSYIAVDPSIDITMISARARNYRVLEYDFKKSFSAQTVAIGKSGSTILWAKCTSEEFIRKTMPTSIMHSIGIPAVFSFSISYNIKTINMLRTNNIPVFGCGFVHDAMPRSGVGRPPATMVLEGIGMVTNKVVRSTFGKSTYVEPFLSMGAVQNMILVRKAMPEMWSKVDENTHDIMDRAVIMSG